MEHGVSAHVASVEKPEQQGSHVLRIDNQFVQISFDDAGGDRLFHGPESTFSHHIKGCVAGKENTNRQQFEDEGLRRELRKEMYPRFEHGRAPPGRKSLFLNCKEWTGRVSNGAEVGFNRFE